MLAVVVITAAYINRLMIFRIENRRGEVIGLNRTNGSHLNRSYFGADGGVTVNRITHVGFLTAGVVPSAESITLAYCRQVCLGIRNSLQVRPFDRLYRTKHTSVLILERDRARCYLASLCEEERTIGT